MALVNMKNDPPKKETMLAECCDSDYKPLYPYGLTLCLNNESLKKLGMTTMPKVGSKMVVHALVEVSGISENSSQDQDGKIDEHRSVDLQITDLELLGDEESSGPESRLYGEV